MLTIYGADLSGPANKVRFVANYLGLEYEYKRIKIREGEHLREDFKKLHPSSKVPAIEDDGFILFESNAIIKYLAKKNNSSLYPAEDTAQALVDQWIDFVSIHVGVAINKVVFNRLFAPFINAEVDERSLADGIKFLNRFLPVVEGQLLKNRYLAGEDLTLADITLLSVLDPAEVSEIDLSQYSAVCKWRDELKQMDFYTACHTSYADVLKQFATQ